MTRLTVGVCRETASAERRVALVPESVGRVAALGAHVAVQAGAGAGAGLADAAYAEAGAAVLSRAEVLNRAGLVVGVGLPGRGAGDRLRRGQALMGMLRPLHTPLTMRYLADHGIIAISLDLLPSAPVQRPAGCEPMDATAHRARVSSTAYAQLATAVLAHLIRAGSLHVDLSDPVQDAIVVAHGGNIRNDAVWRQILDVTAVAGLP